MPVRRDRCSIHRLWQWTRKFVGLRLRVGLACGEMQEEHAWNLTREQVALQLQQELSLSKLKLLHESRLQQQYMQSLLNAAQVRKDAPSLTNANDMGRPKESSSEEEDFQGWSEDIEAFFAEVIKESEMMLEWASDQTTEITKTAMDLEFLPTDTNEDRGVQNLEFILQQMYTILMDLTGGEANDMVDNSRKNPLEAWRRLQERYDPSLVNKRNILRTNISPGRCSLQELQAGFERWESYVERYEKMKGKINDEIKLAGLEA